MNGRVLGVALGSVLLCACAHSDRGSRGETRESKYASSRAESDEERVEIPDRKHQRGRLSSAGDELPEQGGRGPEAADEPREDAKQQQDAAQASSEQDEGYQLTALDQGTGEDDRELTQRIRQAVMDEDGLSFRAKNAQIISRDGHVTLRGSVNGQNERETLERLATDVAGPGRVTNELEVND